MTYKITSSSHDTSKTSWLFQPKAANLSPETVHRPAVPENHQQAPPSTGTMAVRFSGSHFAYFLESIDVEPGRHKSACRFVLGDPEWWLFFSFPRKTAKKSTLKKGQTQMVLCGFEEELTEESRPFSESPASRNTKYNWTYKQYRGWRSTFTCLYQKE